MIETQGARDTINIRATWLVHRALESIDLDKADISHARVALEVQTQLWALSHDDRAAAMCMLIIIHSDGEPEGNIMPAWIPDGMPSDAQPTGPQLLLARWMKSIAWPLACERYRSVSPEQRPEHHSPSTVSK